MQASSVKQKLGGVSTFLSKLRWSKEMKNILINGIFLKPSFQWNCCRVESFCDQLYILDWISQLVFSYWSKTIPTNVPHVHKPIFQTPVFSAHIYQSCYHEQFLCTTWLNEDGWTNLAHSLCSLGGYACLCYRNAGIFPMLSCNVHPR